MTGRRCEVVGVGPIPEQSIRQLLTEADITLVITGPDGQPVAVHHTIRAAPPPDQPGQPCEPGGRHRGKSTPPGDLIERLLNAPTENLDHGRTRRLASNAQWKALLTRSGGTCEIPGCTTAYWRCDTHHLEPWEHGGPTDLAKLFLTCPYHHHHVLHAGYTLTRHPHRWQLHRPNGTPIPTPYGNRT